MTPYYVQVEIALGPSLLIATISSGTIIDADRESVVFWGVRLRDVEAGLRECVDQSAPGTRRSLVGF
jgi:hypothetical protein